MVAVKDMAERCTVRSRTSTWLCRPSVACSAPLRTASCPPPATRGSGEERDVVIHTVGPVLYHPIMRFLLVGCRGGFASVSRRPTSTRPSRGHKQLCCGRAASSPLRGARGRPGVRESPGFPFVSPSPRATRSCRSTSPAETAVVGNRVPAFTAGVLPAARPAAVLSLLEGQTRRHRALRQADRRQRRQASWKARCQILGRVRRAGAACPVTRVRRIAQ